MDKTKLRSMTDLSKATGIPQSTLWYWIKLQNLIEKPSIKYGNRMYYDYKKFDAIVASFKEGE